MSMSVTLDMMPSIKAATCVACSVQMPSNSDAALLARLVFAEAIPTQTGTWAIASVVVNRTHAPGFRTTVSGVITQPMQFDATFDGNARWAQAATQDGIRKLNPAACLQYQYSVNAAQNALQGNTNTDAVLYYDDSIGEPSWAKSDKVLPADVIGGGALGNYIDNPTGNGQYFFKYAPPKPKKKRGGKH
jgi:spore germination cell wall hydrolase CwlJ-like protein